MTARLSLLDEPEQESTWTEHPQYNSNSEKRPVLGDHDPDDSSAWGSQQSIKISAPQEIYLQGVQSNPYAPEVVVQPFEDDYSHAQDPSSSNADMLGSDAGIKTPSVALSSATSATSHELIDLGVPEATRDLRVENGSHAASSIYSEPAATGAIPVSDNGDAESHMAQAPNAPGTQLKIHQPSPVLSVEEAARQKEQRSETYTIRHVRWTDQSGRLVESPILVQNQNGPCPLLALINALVLRADSKTEPPIVRALLMREQISLGLLIEAMFEELTNCLGPNEEFPDIEALTQFLTMLHTGMNVNPRLIMVSSLCITLGPYMLSHY